MDHHRFNFLILVRTAFPTVQALQRPLGRRWGPRIGATLGGAAARICVSVDRFVGSGSHDPVVTRPVGLAANYAASFEGVVAFAADGTLWDRCAQIQKSSCVCCMIWAAQTPVCTGLRMPVTCANHRNARRARPLRRNGRHASLLTAYPMSRDDLMPPRPQAGSAPHRSLPCVCPPPRRASCRPAPHAA